MLESSASTVLFESSGGQFISDVAYMWECVWLTHRKIAEEVRYAEENNGGWPGNDTDGSSKDKPTIEAVDELAAILGVQECCPDLAVVVKNKVQNTLLDVPLSRFREILYVTEKWYGYRQVQNVLVEKRNQIIVPTHKTIRNIMRIHSLL